MSIDKMKDFLNHFRNKIIQDTQAGTNYYFDNINSFNENEIKVIQDEIQDEINYHFQDDRTMSHYDVSKEEDLNIAYRLIKESFSSPINNSNSIKKCNIENLKLNQFIKMFQELKEKAYLNNSFEEIAYTLSNNFLFNNKPLDQKKIMHFFKNKKSTMKAKLPVSID